MTDPVNAPTPYMVEQCRKLLQPLAGNDWPKVARQAFALMTAAAPKAEPLSNPQQLEGEDAAWAWVNGRVECDPADIDYSADEMVDAFMAGQASRRPQREAPKVEQEPELKADFTRAHPSGMDDCTYSEIEDALDRKDAPVFGKLGLPLTLAQRVDALTHPAPASDELRDPAVVHVNMLRGGVAKPTPVQIGHLYRGEEAVEVVAEVMRQNPEMFAKHKGPQS